MYCELLDRKKFIGLKITEKNVAPEEFSTLLRPFNPIFKEFGFSSKWALYRMPPRWLILNRI